MTGLRYSPLHVTEFCGEMQGKFKVGLARLKRYKMSNVIHLIHKWPPAWDERATIHGIEAFWDKSLFSCKL